MMVAQPLDQRTSTTSHDCALHTGPASLRGTMYAGRWDIEITGHAHWPVKQVEQDIRERNFEQNIVS